MTWQKALSLEGPPKPVLSDPYYNTKSEVGVPVCIGEHVNNRSRILCAMCLYNLLRHVVSPESVRGWEGSGEPAQEGSSGSGREGAG